jgi:hypothetical protein
MSENSFYSMDRLFEFGMSMAIAQQMVNSINDMMAKMYIPGSMKQFVAMTPPRFNEKPKGSSNEN